jgi:predicted glycogen debranching enzyme
VLVTGFDARIHREGSPSEWISAQRYAPDVTSSAVDNLVDFRLDPWPRWTFRLRDGTRIVQELLVARRSGQTVIRWSLVDRSSSAKLVARPFLAPRDHHALHRENPEFRFEAQSHGEMVLWHPYPGLPAIRAIHNGRYRHHPLWYRGFQLDEERARGFDFIEDAGSPGEFTWDLGGEAEDAAWVLDATGEPLEERAAELVGRLAKTERLRRVRFPSRLAAAADAYLVPRGAGKTVIAGYPWFTDWGRDTFISLEGLCFDTGRFEDARAILVAWAGTVSEGMLPNHFVDQGDLPEFNSVDASLWFVIAVDKFLGLVETGRVRLPVKERTLLLAATQAVLEGYSAGARYGIHPDRDGLLAAGVPGVQLTWMDARVGDWVVTPRIGKPVEIQALWINALRAGARLDLRWRRSSERAHQAFAARFWNSDANCLYDVVDLDHQPGRTDPAIRPNQIFAVGGLPNAVLEGDRASAVVGTVESQLLTPLGLRSLAPSATGYVGHYRGGPAERDAGYHQGTAWPWLLAPFVEAWLRVHSDTPTNRTEARTRFFRPIEAHLDRAGLGHVSEVADGDPPFTPGGCPFQAWSVAAAIRIDRLTAPDQAGSRLD